MGEQTDVTGLVFLRARYYNPTLGTFLTPDAFQPNAPGTQGYNLYSYAANNPTTWTDPTGNAVLIEYSVRGAAAGALIGGTSGFFFCDDTALFDVSFGDSYPGCIFRTALAGAAGGAFFIPGGGFWAAFGTGAIGGFGFGSVFEGTGTLFGDQEFNVGAIVNATIIGAAFGGILWGGARIWQSIKAPETPGPATGGARFPQLSDDVAQQVDEAIERAARGTSRFPGHDGKPYLNSDGALPPRTDYTEWTAAPAGAKRGTDRVIIAGDPAAPDAIYYWDHINPPVRIGP